MYGPSCTLSKLSPPSVPRTPTQCLSLLRSLTRSKALLPGKQLHALLISSGLLLNSSTSLPLLSKLATFYSLCGHTVHARLLFDKTPTKMKTPFLYNALIRGHVQCGVHSDALHLFAHMVSSGHRPDNFSYPFALKACSDLSLLHMGSVIHCKALVSGFGSDEYVQNSLMAMYMNCGDKEAATMLFDGMTNRTVVSWNTMIAGYVQNGCDEEAVLIFDWSVGSGVEIDRATVVSVLPACAHLKDLRRGRQVHELVKEKGFGGYVPVRNSLIDMYAKCGSLEEARSVFDNGMCERDVVSWTAMIGGYALNGREREALALSCQMQLMGVAPNSVTMASLLSACSTLASIEHGKCIHGLCIRLRLELDIIVETALIDMYVKCNSMKLSLLVFARGSKRAGTWNAVISGYARHGRAGDAIKQFKLMLAEAIRPDFATIASLLPAYAESADLQQAKNIHCYLYRMGFTRSFEASTGLVDIYAKAGNLDMAWELFDKLPVKDLVSWSAMIAGYGMHGHAKTAIWLFDRMVESGVEPNEVTCTSVLYSCSHAGLVDEGLGLFDRMLKVHGMKPNVDHYACIVDLLGRAGRLKEAYELIRGMPFEPNHAVWGALLGACVIHENVDFGKLAAERLFEIEPENTGNYVLLGNIYAALGRWEDVESVRRMMVERGLRKEPGCSLIEVRNV
ncbi:pentatricopeptide repeat-containing protein At5g39350 [Phoenix dactylifera]|uniref:Pentatricopeptide repeat-containing protein At5g39350 n=1 Tax=Phoenix dactylifera TaxID=42345 RepID=A0A8B7BXP9_PHODC|nr:pentatricopeptide repeat-containing protein At5g39350 [Phoenix dactylifera]